MTNCATHDCTHVPMTTSNSNSNSIQRDIPITPKDSPFLFCGLLESKSENTNNLDCFFQIGTKSIMEEGGNWPNSSPFKKPLVFNVTSVQIPHPTNVVISCVRNGTNADLKNMYSLSFCSPSTTSAGTPTESPTTANRISKTTTPPTTPPPTIQTPTSTLTPSKTATSILTPTFSIQQSVSSPSQQGVSSSSQQGVSSPSHHNGDIAGGVLGGAVIIVVVFLIWQRCRKSRRLLTLDKEKAVARRSVRQSTLRSLVPTSPTSTMLDEATSFDPTRMVKTGSPFDKSAFLAKNPAGTVHLPLPNNLL